MKTETKYANALETCIDCLKKGIPLAVWVAFGISDEDRIKIIEEAKKALGMSA